MMTSVLRSAARKLRSGRGFTLTELLISVMLLAFVSAIATVMTSAVLSTTTAMQETAQAEVLGNEVLTNIQNELRLGQNITVNKTDHTVTFDRPSTNIEQYTFFIDKNDGKLKVSFNLKISENEFVPTIELLFGGTSYGNLTISTLEFDPVGDGTAVPAVSVTVAYGGKPMWNGSVSVRPISGTIKVTEN